MRIKKNYFYKTSSMSRCGFRSESRYWRETLAYSKADIRKRFKASDTRIEAILTKEQLDEILAKNPETEVLYLND